MVERDSRSEALGWLSQVKDVCFYVWDMLNGAASHNFWNWSTWPYWGSPPALLLLRDSAQRTAELSPCGEEKGIRATLGAADSPGWSPSQHWLVPASPLKGMNTSEGEPALKPLSSWGCSLCKGDMEGLLRPPEFVVLWIWSALFRPFYLVLGTRTLKSSQTLHVNVKVWVSLSNDDFTVSPQV